MIILTGGAGFIGSAVAEKLNREGIDDILIIDNLNTSAKWKNLTGLRFTDYIHKDDTFHVLSKFKKSGISGIIHMGACSSTTEQDADYLFANNVHFSADLCTFAMKSGIRFIYASSAATYGAGENGFSDLDGNNLRLKPINRYGYSKQRFDLHVYRNGLQTSVAGLKFFNVYGPNEYHKGDMASVIYKSFHDITSEGFIRLFRSCKPEYADGGQKRDFIYVKDCADVIYWLLRNPRVNGIFNLGTGQARTWNELAHAVFTAMGRTPDIRYIDMPDHLQPAYQYFTEADMSKLKLSGYNKAFTSLEEGVSDYVREYLQPGKYLASF